MTEPAHIQLDNMERLHNREDDRAVEMGFIDPNQFDDEHEELACGLGRALGVNRTGHFVDVKADAKRIADKYAIAVRIDAYVEDPETGFTWDEHEQTVEPKKN